MTTLRVEFSPFVGLPGSILTEGFIPGYERKGIYPVEAVFSRLDRLEAFFGEDSINMLSQRYQVFARSLTCVSCGLTGSFFAKERTIGKTDRGLYMKWHLNLYAIRLPWEEVLMTKDHIIPVSRGGLHVLENYQTMCCTCNSKKGNEIGRVASGRQLASKSSHGGSIPPPPAILLKGDL